MLRGGPQRRSRRGPLEDEDEDEEVEPLEDEDEDEEVHLVLVFL